MQAARMEAPGQINVSDVAEPRVEENDVLVGVRAAGVCGTDLHIFHGEYEAQYPLTPGHEFSGEVVAVGAEVRGFRVGDRVTVDPNVPCNRCENCKRNAPNQCTSLQALGVTRDGGFAELVVAPESNVFHIGSMSFEQAAMVEPLACVVWGLERLRVDAGERVLVMGAGPMGCLILQAVKARGASQVVVVDRASRRLELAASLGATDVVMAGEDQDRTLRDLAPSGFDVVVDATGIPQVIEKAFDFVRARGRVWLFGVAPVGSEVRVPPYEIFRKDLTVVGSFAVNKTFPQSIALIESGIVRVEALVSHRLPLAHAVEGLRIAEKDPERMKVQFHLPR